ncbi:MAG: glycine--tRNA ligase subunit beta [Spirochaetota bacterium]|nr:glycine--tRNA ligase subunit beta [Spirochaetota bacterium]
MLKNANFLFEIGTEEIPAAYIPSALNAMMEIFKQKLNDSRIEFDEIEVYATPRRLVVLVSNMASFQRECEVEIKGPSARAAYNSNGSPTKALHGFMKANSIKDNDVYKKMTDNGEYVYAIKKMEALSTPDILPEIFEFIITSLSFPKRMRWSDKDINFPRPITYFLILLNNRVIPFELSGIISSNTTRGHYIQSNQMIEIVDINEYEKRLQKHGVILNHHERKEFIRKELSNAASTLGGVLIEDEELLNRVTFLTENPCIIACDFDELYLKIPEIVLITEMKEHQSYFALKYPEGGLMPNFLVVSNNPQTSYIKKGNEKVITARFNDATFFFNEDRKIKLVERVESLKSILFHKDLGTIDDKVKRIATIAEFISTSLHVKEEDMNKIKRAIILCKADLTTLMVSEFSSLQGEVGRIYALLDGEALEVANAISDHYKPRHQDDELPNNMISIVVSLSEKLDNIFGSFSVGNIPKGSVDPYALRRQATAIVEMLIVNKINLCLKGVVGHISKHYKNGDSLVEKILHFITARTKTIFLENGLKHDEIDACLSIGLYDFYELFIRAKSLSDFRKMEGFTQMLLSFKRMNNILSIFMDKNPGYRLQFNPDILKEEEERDLYSFFNTRQAKIECFLRTNRYIELFRLLIDGKSIIDSFFDSVMVMIDDIELRDNRLALLTIILHPFRNFLDFSRIAE